MSNFWWFVFIWAGLAVFFDSENIMKVGSKPRLLTCISNITLSLPGSALKRELNFCNGYLSLLYFWLLPSSVLVTYFLPQQKREIETVMHSLCDLFPHSTITFSLLIMVWRKNLTIFFNWKLFLNCNSLHSINGIPEWRSK